jgi:uncharacterized protein (DUF302 family)
MQITGNAITGRLSILGAALGCFAHAAVAADGIVSTASVSDVKATMDRLESGVKNAGFAVVARIDHADAAAKVDMALRPTQLLIFGNPKGGTPLMQAQQTVGLDLPLKLLAWQDADGKVWISYTDPQWIGAHHGIGEAKSAVLKAIGERLGAIAAAAGSAP